MIDMAFVFTVFMVTLGPIKVIPGFYNFTKEMEPPERRRLALRGAFFATVISLVIAAVMPGIALSWQVSPDELRIGGGILLFAAAYKIINPDPVLLPPEPARNPAISPIAIPIIITPWGAAAIMIAMGLAADSAELTTTVVTNLLLIMALNLAGMLFAPLDSSGDRCCIFQNPGLGIWRVTNWVRRSHHRCGHWKCRLDRIALTMVLELF